MNEIKAAVDGQAWMLALTGVLSLPDMCAALESENGKTTGQKYKAWVRAWLGDKYTTIDPDDLWQLRCSMLHQGRSKTATYSRIIFVAPNNVFSGHNNILNDALNLDLPTFCQDVLTAVKQWQKSMEGNSHYLINSIGLMRWYPHGLPPYIVGPPVLS